MESPALTVTTGWCGSNRPQNRHYCDQ